MNLEQTGTLRARGFCNGSIYEASLSLGVALKLEMPMLDGLNRMTLNASAPLGSKVVLQTSTDLKQWTSLQTNSIGSRLPPWVLTISPSSYGFYRLVQIE